MIILLSLYRGGNWGVWGREGQEFALGLNWVLNIRQADSEIYAFNDFLILLKSK